MPTKPLPINAWTWELIVSLLWAAVLIAINFFVASSAYDYHCNPGIAFGIELPQTMFILLWSATMAIIWFLWRKAHHSDTNHLQRIGFVLIFSGGIANITDRVLHGCVIDYIAIVPWNTFNLADASIFIGAMIVLWHSYKGEKSAERE